MKATMVARLRGMRMTYAQYLASDHWADVKRRYRGSGLPQRCLGCGNAREGRAGRAEEEGVAHA